MTFALNGLINLECDVQVGIRETKNWKISAQTPAFSILFSITTFLKLVPYFPPLIAFQKILFWSTVKKNLLHKNFLEACKISARTISPHRQHQL
jgi:hypothetical protein